MPPGAWPGTGGARHAGGAWRTAPWSLDGRESGRGRTHRKRERRGGGAKGRGKRETGWDKDRAGERERGGGGRESGTECEMRI